jgi:hypothetical protein
VREDHVDRVQVDAGFQADLQPREEVTGRLARSSGRKGRREETASLRLEPSESGREVELRHEIRMELHLPILAELGSSKASGVRVAHGVPIGEGGDHGRQGFTRRKPCSFR